MQGVVRRVVGFVELTNFRRDVKLPGGHSSCRNGRISKVGLGLRYRVKVRVRMRVRIRVRVKV